MPKRFTDTNKYKKPFIRSLPGAYKLLWDFLYHDCDHAGIWIVDFEIAQAYVGSDMPIKKDVALELFNTEEKRIVEIDGGKKWFIPSFIEFQYIKLSDNNRAHLNVISVLKKFDLLNTDLTLKLEIKPLPSPLQGVKEQVQEQEKEQEQDFGKSENLLPKMFLQFKKKKPSYPEDRERDMKALQSISVFICKQLGISYQPQEPDVGEKVMEAWSTIVDFISDDQFYNSKSLTSISYNIQSVISSIQNGKSNTKNTKQSAGSKITGADLNAARAKFRGQRQST
jgi:hypothetical protein